MPDTTKFYRAAEALTRKKKNASFLLSESDPEFLKELRKLDKQRKPQRGYIIGTRG